MYSHVAFLPAIGSAAVCGVHELALLQSLVLGLSIAYHRSVERPGVLAQCEGTAAKSLFTYGSAQTLLNCPDVPMLFVDEIGCLVATTSIFVVTTACKHDFDMYDRWHPWGMHVVPGCCSLLVASHHSAFLF